MMNKKAKKSKPTAKKAAKKKGASSQKKELNPAEVRKDISMLVEVDAKEMAQAVIVEGKKGQLAPVKYLFEMAHIFPPASDEGQATTHEDSLAQTLLQRLNLPDTPMVADQDDADDGDTMVIPAKVAESKQEKSAEENTGIREERGEEVPVG
jgi:hypothetical protein